MEPFMAQIRGKRTNMKDRVLAPPGQDWQSHLDHVVNEGLSLSIIICWRISQQHFFGTSC